LELHRLQLPVFHPKHNEHTKNYPYIPPDISEPISKEAHIFPLKQCLFHLSNKLNKNEIPTWQNNPIKRAIIQNLRKQHITLNNNFLTSYKPF
jgi:hypothetical protein